MRVAQDIARKAGSIMRRYFRVENGLEDKSDGSPVTLADTSINRMVIEELGRHFSDVVIGEEESTGEYGAGRRWICDPLDGTKAYVLGLPTAMFSLGLVVDGVPMLGVAYDPFLDVLYDAVRGGGSRCNGKPIHVSHKTLAQGHMALSSSIGRILKNPTRVRALIEHGTDIVSFNGAVYKMCLVAQGFFEGYFEEGVNAHDVAASHIILEEAGGRVTGLDGAPLDYRTPLKGVVCSNGVAHADILQAVTCV